MNLKKKFNKKAVVEASLNPVLIVAGLAGAGVAANLIDKALKVDEITEEGFSIKKIISPLVLITAGIAANVLIDNKSIKLVATGVAAGGVAKGVKVFLKKDLVNGFQGLGEASPVRQLMIEPYNPELPELNSPDTRYLPIDDDSDLEGLGNDYTEITSDTFVQ